MKDGLKFSRLPSGAVLIKFSDIDGFLEQYAITGKEEEAMVDAIVGEMLEGL